MNKTALITGGSRGIGRGIAEELSKEGFDIAIVYVSNKEAAEDVLNACLNNNVKAIAIQADISSADDRKRIIEIVKKEFTRLDILVNNAGVAPDIRADILEASEKSFDRLIRINLKGPYFLSQLAANWMIKQKKKDKTMTPMIINIASISSYTSSPGRGEYCISKAGISMMTKLYADRLSEFGINVYEIRPGVIKTDMTAPVTKKYDKLIAQGLTPIKRWGRPDDIGRAVSAIAKGHLPFSTGEVINVDGGFHLKRL